MTSEDKKIPVMEVFGPTVQGEGLVVGQRTIFIRFGLCDYRCTMCDSMHAVDPKSVKANAEYLTQQEILDRIMPMLKDHNCGSITLSGGNPAMHDLYKLVTFLGDVSIYTSVETQGTIWNPWIQYCNYICISPKGPGMGEKFEQDRFFAFYEKVKHHTGLYIKVPVFDARDLEFASAIAEMIPDIVQSDRFYLSEGNPNPPVLGEGDGIGSTEAAHWDSIKRYKELIVDIHEYPSLRYARVLPQLHTWVWGNERGR